MTWASLAVVALLLPFISATPFQMVQQYVDDFAHGVEELKKLAHEYHFKEDHFDPSHYNETEALKDAHEFDFIIVGAGASGAALANRLSEVPEWHVLLLEAGAAETPQTQIPALGHLLQTTPYSWGYKTEAQESWCLGNIDHRCPIATGKALGGSTAINGFLYTRGNARDYDRWADLDNKGWCYEDVLPYFKKSEDAHLHYFDRNYHSQGGPLHVEDPQYQTHLVDNFLTAGKEVGLKTVDYNGKVQIGVGHPQLTTKGGHRNSAAQAYLFPAQSRKNLVVKPLSHVIKVIISPHTKEAYGVKYVHDGKLFIAKATKEVILAAGAINTPQLLLLSGIGPKDDLEKLDIHHLVDLKVGHGLKDHAAFIGLNYFYNHSGEDVHHQPHDPHDDLVAYLKSGKGPLTVPSTEAVGYVKTEASKEKGEVPDVELLLTRNIYNHGHEALRALNIKPEVYDSLWKPLEGKIGFTIAVVPTHPKSVGVVKLKSKDPFKHPEIHLPQLSDPDESDLETALKGVHKALTLGKSEAFGKIGAELNHHQVHGCEQHEFATNDYWKCAIRHLSISLRHLSGTARMGPETDKHAVVDNKLNVHGVHKLRVADTSVIPVSLAAHYHAPAVLIGEKAADLIKEHWK